MFEAFNLAIQHVLRQNPVGYTAAIESAGFRRFLEDRYLVAEPRQLVGGAVPSGTRSDNGDLLAVGLPRLNYVVRQRLAEIAKKAFDRADRDGLVVFSAIAGLLARVVAHPARDRRKRHVFLDERVGIEILAALHQVEIALNLFVGAASVVAGGQFVAIDRANRTPVAGGKQVLPFFLRGRGRDAGERHGKPVGNMGVLG